MGNAELQSDCAPDIIMALEFEHYSLRRKVLLRKLRYAQAATRLSLEHINKLSAPESSDSSVSSLEIEKYDALWSAAIGLFQDAFVSDEALVQIEDVLSSIPLLIGKFYDALIERDAVLQDHIKQLLSDDYKQAIALIRDTQGESCIMSNLDAKEFDFEDAKKIRRLDVYL